MSKRMPEGVCVLDERVIDLSELRDVLRTWCADENEEIWP